MDVIQVKHGLTSLQSISHRGAEFDDHFAALARSRFRSRFRLNPKDRAYFVAKGLDVIMEHARGFLATRLFPAQPANDGRQTPMRGHPVFVAQHATATCCRGCLAKWHGIPSGRPLTEAEQTRVLDVIRCWLGRRAVYKGALPC